MSFQILRLCIETENRIPLHPPNPCVWKGLGQLARVAIISSSGSEVGYAHKDTSSVCENFFEPNSYDCIENKLKHPSSGKFLKPVSLRHPGIGVELT